MINLLHTNNVCIKVYGNAFKGYLKNIRKKCYKSFSCIILIVLQTDDYQYKSDV